MASRAILHRKKKFLFDYLTTQNTTSSIRALSTSLHQRSPSSRDSNQSPSPSNGFASGVKDESLASFARNTFLAPKAFRNGESISILSPRFGSGSIRYRYLSTATAPAPEPEPGNEDGNGSKKETSPEDCDLAVENLKSSRAKAQAKRSQESQEIVQRSTVQRVILGPLQKLWAMVLGIGPALRVIASMNRKDWAVKLGHWKTEFVDTMKHYWLGLKLLWADVRISSRLMKKLAKGKSLSRRERQQLTRTTADIFRLVPVAVFLIVPFMEFLLPVFLKLFPNMLPSTFQDKLKEEEAKKRRLKARIEYAKFLQDTVKEMAKEVQSSRSGETRQTAEELEEFLNKVRTGGRVSNEEILGFAKLFNDELTLDNISRPRLVNMCKYMGISPYGTDAYLRFMLRSRLNTIKNDDKMIQEEGVETLSDAELRQACRDRGILGTLSVEEMRQQLRDWLDLSLNRSLPSSFLILSRAFTVSGKLKIEEVVANVMTSLPDEVVDTVEITLPSDDSAARTRRKLERLEQEEERIKEEELKEARMQEAEISKEDVALAEMTTPTAGEAQKQAIAKTFEKKDQLCRLSRALALLASASSVSSEREDFMKLVNKEIEMYNSMVDKEGTEGEEEAKQAYRAAREDSDHDAERDVGNKVTDALISRVDSMLHNLEKEIDDVDATIGNRWRKLDRDYDGKVTAEELVATAAAYLKDTLDKEGIQELISSLSKDSEGKILVQDIVKLGALTEDVNENEAERR